VDVALMKGSYRCMSAICTKLGSDAAGVRLRECLRWSWGLCKPFRASYCFWTNAL
jgi:hypothetical protein